VQLFRYALVGALSNVASFFMYLAVTWLGASPKVSMSLLYCVSAAIGFLGNRSITFAHNGNLMKTGARYVFAHSLGYLLNFCLLIIFVDSLGYPHQWVQAIAIFVVAGFLFLAFKIFVFPATGEHIVESR